MAVASCMQVFIVHAWVVPMVAVRWQRGETDRKNEHADLSKAVSCRISASKESVIQF